MCVVIGWTNIAHSYYLSYCSQLTIELYVYMADALQRVYVTDALRSIMSWKYPAGQRFTVNLTSASDLYY